MERVRVYWNLHRNLFSIMSMKTGRVIGHAEAVSLKNANFVVRPGGRAKVLREKRKNVHAFVIGELTTDSLDEGVHVSYNPYETATFVDVTGKPVQYAPGAVLRKIAGKPVVRLAQAIPNSVIPSGDGTLIP